MRGSDLLVVVCMEALEQGTLGTSALGLLLEAAKSCQVLLVLCLFEGWHSLRHPAGSIVAHLLTYPYGYVYSLIYS